MTGGQLGTQVRDPHDARLGCRVRSRPHPAIDQEAARPLLGVDPVRDAGVGLREHEPHAAVGIDVHLVTVQARLPVREVARLEPA
jgi:hypothetical protein